MIQLRRLEAVHRRDVLQIQRGCYREIEPESWASLQAKVLAAPDHCFVAEVAAGVVGYLVSVPIRFPDLPVLGAPVCWPVRGRAMG